MMSLAQDIAMGGEGEEGGVPLPSSEQPPSSSDSSASTASDEVVELGFPIDYEALLANSHDQKYDQNYFPSAVTAPVTPPSASDVFVSQLTTQYTPSDQTDSLSLSGSENDAESSNTSATQHSTLGLEEETGQEAVPSTMNSNAVWSSPDTMPHSQTVQTGPQSAIEHVGNLVSDAIQELDHTMNLITQSEALNPGQTWPSEPFEEVNNMATDLVDTLQELEHTMSLDLASGPPLQTEPDLFSDFSYGTTGIHDASNMPYYLQEQDRSINFTCEELFLFWRSRWLERKPGYPKISIFAEHSNRQPRPATITSQDMAKKDMDLQGIHWSRFAATKDQARKVRRMLFRNHVHLNKDIVQAMEDWGTERFPVDFSSSLSPVIPKSDNYFRFRQTNSRHTACIRHYQLRHNIFAASQNAIYYHRSYGSYFMDPLTNIVSHPRNWAVLCYNPLSDTSNQVMTPKKAASDDSPRLEQLSTLSASHDILVVGSMSGIYGLRSLNTSPSSQFVSGHIIPATNSQEIDKSTNHVHTYLSRNSGLPLAVFNSNDRYVRTLDCTTDTWLTKHEFNTAVNCSVTDPSGRLRLLVSDDPVPIIADAETGEQLVRLPGHTDHGFACAWAPDGVTLSTGYQDGIVQIFDARKLTGAIARIPSEQSCVRTMQFSPLGGGKPVLVTAEQGDFVHVIDAVDWSGKQTIEFFGDVAGVSITPDGRSLWVANHDPGFGGLMEFERCGEGRDGWDGRKGVIGESKAKEKEAFRRGLTAEDLADVLDNRWGGEKELKDEIRKRWECERSDWLGEGELDADPRNTIAEGARWRRYLGLGELIV